MDPSLVSPEAYCAKWSHNSVTAHFSHVDFHLDEYVYSKIFLISANLVGRLRGLAIVFAEDPDDTDVANSDVPGM